MRHRRALAAAIACCAVAGCTASELDGPVPTAAAGLFLCDGVPAQGLQPMTGIEDLVVDDSAQGPWDDNVPCAVDDDEGRAVASISHQSTEGLGVVTSAEQLAEPASNADAEPIEDPAPGAGFALPDRKQRFARWICDDGTRTEVRLHRQPSGEDVAEDLARYLSSVLPWAGGSSEAPTRTAQ